MFSSSDSGISEISKLARLVQAENSTTEWAQSEIEYYAKLMDAFNLFEPLEHLEQNNKSEEIEGYEPQVFSESDLKEVTESEVEEAPEKKRRYRIIPAVPLIPLTTPIEGSNEDTQPSTTVEKTEVSSTDYKPPVDVTSSVDHQEVPAESRTDNEEDDKDPLSAGSIRGIPGVHFPDYEEIPMSSFECKDKEFFPGFYADMETGCQVFHVCYQERRESFLCPVGTIFNQAILTCDNWYSSNCSFTPSFYSSNAGIGGWTDDETTPEYEQSTSTEGSPSSSTQAPTTESYDPSESEGDGEFFHFKRKHPNHSKRISPEEFFELFTKYFPIKVKVSVFPVTNQTKVIAVASVGDHKTKYPTQHPGKPPHPTRPGKPQHSTKRYEPPTKRPYPTRRTRPTRRHYPKTTTTRKTYTTTTRKPYTTTTTTQKPYTTTTRKPYTTTTTYKPPTTTTKKPYPTTSKPYHPPTTSKPYHPPTTSKPYHPPTTRRPPKTTTRRPYHTTRRPYPTTRRPHSTTKRPYYPPTRDPYQRGIDPSVNQDITDAFEIARRILEHVGQMFPRGDGSYHPNPGSSYPTQGSSNEGSSYPNQGSSNQGSSYPNEGSSYPNEDSSYPDSSGSSYPGQSSSSGPRSCPCIDSRGTPTWCSCAIDSDPTRWCRCYNKHGHMRRCPCSVHPRWCPCLDPYGRRSRCPCRYPRSGDVSPSDVLIGGKNCTKTGPGHEHGPDGAVSEHEHGQDGIASGHDHGQDGGYGDKNVQDNSGYETPQVRSYKPLVELNPRFIVKPVYL